MEVIQLYEGLTEVEIKTIPDEISNKLVQKWQSRSEELDKIKTEYETFKISNEQKCFDSEQKLAEFNSKLKDESVKRSEFESQNQRYVEKISDLERDLQQLSTKCSTLECQLQLSKSEGENMINNSSALSGTLETKDRLIGDLKAQITALEKQVASAMRAKAEAQIQSEEALSMQSKLEHHEKRLSEERTLLRGQVQLLHSQLEKRIQENCTQRNDQATHLMQLKQDLHNSNIENKMLKQYKEEMEKKMEEKTKRVEELLESLKDVRNHELKLEESFRMELTAQMKLSTIHKATCSDLKMQKEELERGVTELRSLLESASEQYGALERNKEQALKEMEKELLQKEEELKEMKEELEKVNVLLEANASKDTMSAMYELTPGASAAAQLLSKGMSLSQLYAQYLTTTDKLTELEEKNERLTRYIDQMLQEIEERAPLLQQQREEYSSAMETISSLQQQLQATRVSSQGAREDNSELERRVKYLLREQETLTNHNADLSRQVSVLLMQIESARAGLPPPSLDMSEMEGDVVSSNLVCFRDVSELQQQNQKLIHTIRELKQQADQAEKNALEKYLQEIQGELSAAKEEVEELRAGRDRIESLVENISRQRDTYKSLLANGDSASSKTISDSDSSQLILKEEINKLKINLEAARKTEEELREQLKASQRRLADKEAASQSQMEEMRSTLEKTREQNVKLLSHAEYNDERLKTLQSNCESFQRQVNGLEEKSGTLQTIVGRHEATIDHLRQEHKTLVHKLSHAEVIASNLKEEQLLFKETEARLLAEKESYSRNSSSQAMLLTSLESIKNNLEHKDTTERMRAQNTIAELSDQNNRLKAKLEANTDLRETRTKLSSLEDKLHISERERENNAQHLQSAKEQLVTLQQRYDEAVTKEREASLSLRDLQTSRAGIAEDASEMNQRDWEVQLAEEKAKVKALERSLGQAKQTITDLTNTCEQQEKAIKETAEASNTTITRLEEVANDKTSIERKVAELRAKVQDDSMTMDSLKQRVAELESTIANYNDMVDGARQQQDEARRVDDEARKKVEDMRKEMLEVQQKYEREVMLHGSDLQALAQLKERLSSHDQAMEKVTLEKIKAQETLAEVTQRGTELQDSLKREIESLKSRGVEMEEQNKSLLEQFTQLSDKMATVQTKLIGEEAAGGNVSFSEEEARTADQLREVMKYLRRERELATSRCEVAVAETNRLRAQWESANNHISQLKKELTEERESKQVSMDSASRYGELLRKEHTMDALADSNRLLRQEKDLLKERTQVAEEKTNSLVAEVEPLRTKMAEALAEAETLKVEKTAAEKEVDLYKKRIQNLMEKLNRAKPEEFLRIQQELSAAKSSVQTRETEANRLKMQVQQLQKNLQTMVTSKEETKKQLTASAQERMRLTEENKKVLGEKARLVQQLGQHQEKSTSMQKELNSEKLKQLGERNKLLEQLSESRQKEEAAKRDMEATIKEKEAMTRELNNKNSQLVQLRKIATKYKKGAESAASLEEKVSELEETVTSLNSQLETSKSDNSSESSTRSKLVEAELTRLRTELESKTKELGTYKAAVTKQISDTNKKLEEYMAKKSVYEARILQLEKELSGQRSGDKVLLPSSKPSTSSSSSSSISSEKSSQELPTPPTANIKPLAAATPSASASPSPRAVSTPPSNRSIPTASIRPLAATGPSMSSTGLGLQRDIHSEGLVSSSTVTLPQATVTPTPATPSATLSSTATTSATTHTSSLATTPSTLTATISPTPLTAQPTPNQMSAGLVVAQQPEPMDQLETEDPLQTGAADDLISQALAMIAPNTVTIEPVAGPSDAGTNTQAGPKRKREDEETEEGPDAEEVAKRSRVETEGGDSASSSYRPEVQREEESDDVILLESDGEQAPEAPHGTMETPSESYHLGVHQQPSSSSGSVHHVTPLGTANDRVGSSGGAEVTVDASLSTQGHLRRAEAGFSEPVSSPQRGGAPLSPAAESGVSTSDSTAAVDSAVEAGGEGEVPLTGQRYTEADSVAQEDMEEEEQVGEEEEEDEAVEEDDEDSAPNEGEDDEEDDVDVVEDNEDDEMSSDLQMPGEAQQQKQISSGGDSSGAEEVSGSCAAPSSSSSHSMAPNSPSSSKRRDITKITWGEEQAKTSARGRAGPYRTSGRIAGRRQGHEEPEPQPIGASRGTGSPQRAVRGGQKARRSRQAPHM